jgi:hypothetical protein
MRRRHAVRGCECTGDELEECLSEKNIFVIAITVIARRPS